MLDYLIGLDQNKRNLAARRSSLRAAAEQIVSERHPAPTSEPSTPEQSPAQSTGTAAASYGRESTQRKL